MTTTVTITREVEITVEARYIPWNEKVALEYPEQQIHEMNTYFQDEHSAFQEEDYQYQ